MKPTMIQTLFLLVGTVVLCNSASIDEMIKRAENKVAMDQMARDYHVKLLEMDIMLTMEDYYIIQSLMSMTTRKKRKALNFESRRWTNKIVPYTVESSFSSRDMQEVNNAIADWEFYTCLKFRRATASDQNQVAMQNGGGCASYIGMIGGSQLLYLAPGCRYKGIIAHEIGHAIGFFHEQSRPDRDQYVTIKTENIQSGAEGNFQKYSDQIINTFNVPYDYTSVMHYGKNFFTKNGQPTIITTDPTKRDVIGNRDGLSFRDIQIANLMYKCSEGCNNPPSCPTDAYVGKDCKCWCPGSPAKHCDNTPTEAPTPSPSPSSSAEPPSPSPSEPGPSPTSSPTSPPTGGELLRYGDWCFYDFEEKKNQGEAEQSCRQSKQGGHLAWFSSEQEWSALAAALLPKTSVRRWFTGLEEAEMFWNSGIPVTFVNFHRNEPNRNYEECVTMERPHNYQWADVRCSRREAYVCRVECPGCSGCSFKYNGACFKTETSKKTQADAEQSCANWKEGAHLAWFNDEDECSYVASQLQRTYYIYYWYIGMIVKDRLVYTSGAKVTFTKWGSRQPNGRSDMCVSLDKYQVPKYSWDDTKCPNKEAYICKAPCTETVEDDCETVSGPGPHDDDCLRKWWVDAGCSLDGEGLTSAGTDYNSLTVSEVKNSMLYTRISALEEDQNAIRMCFGSNNIPNDGWCDPAATAPHTTTCLMKWWIESGCSPRGTGSPVTNQTAQSVWSQSEARTVQQEMRLTRSKAFQGVEGYAGKCYGEKFAVDCGIHHSMGPHPISCLTRWWYNAGCAPAGSSSPLNQDPTTWDDLSVGETRVGMLDYRTSAMKSEEDENGESFVYKCYGEFGFPVCSCDSPSAMLHEENTTCLMKWWLDLGCTPKGTLSPTRVTKGYPPYTGAMADVKKAMKNIRDKAFTGDSQAALQCFGHSFEANENCDNRYAKGPHKMACLMKWWIAATCRPYASGSPSGRHGMQNLSFWNSKRANQVQHYMRNYQYNAARGKSINEIPYMYLCYGV